MKQALLIFFLFVCVTGIFAQTSISLIVPSSLNDTSITAITIKDVQQLLAQSCNCDVTLNDTTAQVILKLPEVNAQQANQLNRFAQKANFPYRNYPEHNYIWKQHSEGKRIVLELSATSWQGVSFGLYGLLQEKLGFRFYHPRRSIIPHWNQWPLLEDFTWNATALFDKSGFHLHTEHPIELTEQLLDPSMPNALDDVKEYINWLVRNGQTYFEFCLLESVDRKQWPAHAKAIVDYAHSRGILAAVDVSLHMIQQKTFQLYCKPPKSFLSKKKQIEKNLKWLTQADWDFTNMEFSTAEFIEGNQGKKEALRQFIIQWLKDNTHTKLMGRQHVVQPKAETAKKTKPFEWDSASLALDKERGVLSHTVMFYSMTEPHAPVYENENQRHMFDFLLREMKVRETWYYPESAYWVTFDNSVPMFLLPYLQARLSDIDTCVAYKVPGHITFSSGWEWGYWLFDWSIARWSWQYTTNGIAEKRTPTMYAEQLMDKQPEKNLFVQQLTLQQRYLKDSTLIQWMTAMSVLDEIGIKALNKEYQPRPKWSYKYLRRKADSTLLNDVRNRILPLLDAFAIQTKNLIAKMKSYPTDSISNEWIDGIEITGLRAQHRYYTLQYILTKRASAIHKSKCNCDSLLNNAASIREQAQQIVSRREQHYRYPLSLIAAKRWDHTAYHFGYLYPASNLHFWQREEEQARRNNYSPLFMNIWNMLRIAGVID